MFGVPLDREVNMYCDNEVMYKNATILDSVLFNEHHLLAYHVCREAVASGMVRISGESALTNLVALFTKVLPRAVEESLLDIFMY